MKTILRNLPCRITDQEKLHFASVSARETELWQSVEEKKKEANAEFKSEIEQHRGEVLRLSRIIDTGIDFRTVECEIHLNFAENIAKIIRQDTQEIVETRPMTDEEQQRAMDLL